MSDKECYERVIREYTKRLSIALYGTYSEILTLEELIHACEICNKSVGKPILNHVADSILNLGEEENG